MLSLRENKLLSLVILGNVINSSICCFFIVFLVKEIKVNFYILSIVIILLIASAMLQIIMVKKVYNNIKRIKDKSKMFEQALEALPNPVFIHKKLKFIYTNGEGAKFFNVKNPEQIIGKSVSDFVKLNVDLIGDQRIDDVLNESNFKPLVENIITKANGEVVEVETFSNPINVDGTVAVLNTLRDLTEHKKLERLEKKVNEEKRKLKEAIEIDRLRSDFFANLSHELRTPLTIIFGTLQLIEREQKEILIKDEFLKKRVKTLKQNCYRLLRLINNLIDMTKIDAGYFTVSLKNHDIIPIVEDISLSVVEFAENKGIKIQFDTEIEEKIIACDPDKIERIMLNLLSNAIKFTNPNGNIQINVYDGESDIKIVVKDDGIGIPKEKLDSVFGRFIQVDKSLCRNHEGSGLGLSIAKSFVEMHGGTIKVESEYGNGTEFIIILPITLVEDNMDVIDYEAVAESHVQRVNIEFSDIYS